jgi:predicted permease
MDPLADRRSLRWLEETARDVRLGLQTLARYPSFSVVAVLTLGVTIGLNLAVYAVVQAVLLRPLPFEDPDRLVTIYNSFPGRGADRIGNSIPDFFLRRERVAGLEDVALYVPSAETVGERDTTERVPGLRVTPSFFRTLGVDASLGRTFLEEEMSPGAEPAVLLTDGYWRARFGASPDVLGRTLRIDGVASTVVGVLPSSFRLPAQPDARLVRPLAFPPSQGSLENWGGNNDFFMLGRLAPGTNREQLETELATLYANVARELLGEAGVRQLNDLGYRAIVVDAADDLVRGVKGPLVLLWAAVGFVLLIGCVNIASLMLARSEVRLPELATRAALGAGRLRLTRLAVSEAAVIGVAGGIAGIAFAALVLQLLGVAVLSPPGNTDGTTAGAMGLSLLGPAGGAAAGHGVGLPASAIVVGVALGLLTAMLFGGLPVVNVFRNDLWRAFAHDGRGRTAGRRAVAVRGGLVAGQVALTFMLLAGAGLMLRSFQRAMAVEPGFEAEGVVTGFTSLSRAVYRDEDARRAFYDAALREIRRLPGVDAAGVTSLLPFGPVDRTTSIAPVGYERAAGEPAIVPNWAIVSPGYFEALEIALLEGRAFEDRDGPDRPPVLVIDEWLARRFWPARSPLGEQMSVFNRTWTVIGVVDSIRQQDLTAAASAHVGAFYLPYMQMPAPDMALVVRPSRPGLQLAGDIRAALNRVAPDVPLFDVRTLDARLADSLGSRRTVAVLLIGFAGVALLLAAVGTYGVLAYGVAQRTRETAIRMALGSRPADVRLLVLRQGVVLGVLGLAGGAMGAFFLVGLVQSMLFGTEPLDPPVLAVTALVLGLSVVLASVVPARRATRIDPVKALAEQ